MLALPLLLLAAQEAATPERTADGVALALGGRRVELRVCRENVIRVLDTPVGGGARRESLMLVKDACQRPPLDVKTGDGATTLATKRLAARIEHASGAVTFTDPSGRVLLAEKQGGGRSLLPASVMGEDTYHVQAQFEPNAGEAFYGLGAHQHGLMNYAGRDVDLYQHNIVDVVPFLVSSRGYGLLWDNTSHTKFGDVREPVHIPAANLSGGLQGTYRQGDCETGSVVATRLDPQV